MFHTHPMILSLGQRKRLVKLLNSGKWPIYYRYINTLAVFSGLAYVSFRIAIIVGFKIALSVSVNMKVLL